MIIRILVLVAILFLTTSCASQYVEPSANSQTAIVSFERESISGIFGSMTIFVSVDSTFPCKPAGGFTGQQRMATIDKGNPIVGTNEQLTFRVLPESNYRLLIRNVAGFDRCDVVLGFRTDIGKTYKVVAKEDSKSNEFSCSAEVFEIGIDVEEKIELNEYQECKI